MPKTQGPVDDTVKSLADIMIQYRGRRLDSLDESEKMRYQNEVGKLMKFVVRVGLFAAADEAMVEAVFLDIIDGLRSKIGLLRWIRSSAWLLAMISRGLTPSGKIYVETRQRIRAVTFGKTSRMTDSDAPKFDEKLSQILFDEKFKKETCSLKKHKKNKQINSMVFCKRGCDLLLLHHLGFHAITIGRIHGLKDTTAVDRLRDCEGAWITTHPKRAPGTATAAKPS